MWEKMASSLTSLGFVATFAWGATFCVPLFPTSNAGISSDLESVGTNTICSQEILCDRALGVRMKHDHLECIASVMVVRAFRFLHRQCARCGG